VGAWGIGLFENDDAMDWAVYFRDAPSALVLADAFVAIIGVEDYIERDAGSYALAAAEVLAAVRGRPCRDFPTYLKDWASAHPEIVTPALLTQALAAIDRAMMEKSSEIAELWAEGERAADWIAVVEDLKSRLRGEAPHQT